MVGKWVPFVLRFSKDELRNVDAFCKDHCLKRNECFKISIRLLMAHPDLINGVVNLGNNNSNLDPLIEKLSLFSQKFERIEKSLSELAEGQPVTSSKVVKDKIAEIILQMKNKNKSATTTDKLREHVKGIDPSLEQYLVASASTGISLFNETIIELQERGELTWEIGGIIKW